MHHVLLAFKDKILKWIEKKIEFAVSVKHRVNQWIIVQELTDDASQAAHLK